MIDLTDDDIHDPPVNNSQKFVNGTTYIQDVVYLLLDCDLLLR